MQDIVLIPIPFEQLKTEISDTVKKEMQTLISLLQQQQSQPAQYLTRKETARRLGVSLVTLTEWSKQGIVKGYRIASRVRYKQDEIEAALIQMKTGRRAA